MRQNTCFMILIRDVGLLTGQPHYTEGLNMVCSEITAVKMCWTSGVFGEVPYVCHALASYDAE